MAILKLVRGEDAAIVDEGSDAEKIMRGLGFVDAESWPPEVASDEADEGDEQPVKRGPGRPRKK